MRHVLLMALVVGCYRPIPPEGVACNPSGGCPQTLSCIDGVCVSSPPGIDAKDTTLVYTINGLTTQDITARRHERLRFRFINGFQRNVIAIKIEKYDVRVMALDGQPSEPFLARDGTLVLAPGTRVDAFVDATAPGSTSSILLHDGKAPRPIARLIVSNEPPVRNAPLPAAAPTPAPPG